MLKVQVGVKTKVKTNPKRGIKVFVIDYMFEKVIKQRDKFKSKLKETKKLLSKIKKQQTETRNLLYKAQEIITRFENKRPEIYSCDCSKKNKFATELFFEKIVSLNNKYNKGT